MVKGWLGLKMLRIGTRWAWKGLWMAGLAAAAKGAVKRNRRTAKA